MRNALLFAVCVLTAPVASAYHLKVQGVVTDHFTREPIKGVLVRVYKNGQKVDAAETQEAGRYSFKLDNQAGYVIRFSAPGMVTKSYSLDTHGLEWQGEDGQKALTIEMTMIERVQGVDLSVFDLPMGLARFEPSTGLVTWDTSYDLRVREEVEQVMAAYTRRLQELATAEQRVGR